MASSASTSRSHVVRSIGDPFPEVPLHLLVAARVGAHPMVSSSLGGGEAAIGMRVLPRR